MAEPTLQQIFGNSATQNATDIIIKKSDLAAKGLTASVSNRAEALLAAIIFKAQEYLTTTNQGTNADIQITIENSFESLTTRNNVNYRQKSLTINLQKADTGTTYRADDF